MQPLAFNTQYFHYSPCIYACIYSLSNPVGFVLIQQNMTQTYIIKG